MTKKIILSLFLVFGFFLLWAFLASPKASAAQADIAVYAPTVTKNFIGGGSGPPSPFETVTLSSQVCNISESYPISVTAGMDVADRIGSSVSHDPSPWAYPAIYSTNLGSIQKQSCKNFSFTTTIQSAGDSASSLRMFGFAWAYDNGEGPSYIQGGYDFGSDFGSSIGATTAVRVYDNNGNPINNANVSISNNGSRSPGSQSGNQYWFYHLNCDYSSTITVSAPGFNSQTVNVTLNSWPIVNGNSYYYDITLQPPTPTCDCYPGNCGPTEYCSAGTKDYLCVGSGCWTQHECRTDSTCDCECYPGNCGPNEYCSTGYQHYWCPNCPTVNQCQQNPSCGSEPSCPPGCTSPSLIVPWSRPTGYVDFAQADNWSKTDSCTGGTSCTGHGFDPGHSVVYTVHYKNSSGAVIKSQSTKNADSSGNVAVSWDWDYAIALYKDNDTNYVDAKTISNSTSSNLSVTFENLMPLKGYTYHICTPNCGTGDQITESDKTTGDCICCSCGSWSNGSCGGSCSATERRQTRTCTPSGCKSESRCVSDSSCGPIPTPTPLPTVCTNTNPGTNQLKGCVFDGTNFDSPAGNAPDGSALTSPVSDPATAIDKDWANGGPNSTTGVDTFSARWKGNFTFHIGTYTFYTPADDGVRLKIDGAIVINSWVDSGFGEPPGPARTYTTTFTSQAQHLIELEYYENGGGSRVKLNWVYVPKSPPCYCDPPTCAIRRGYGDVDADGDVDWRDADQIAKHFSGKIILDGDNFKAANLNGDLTVGSSDYGQMNQFLAGSLPKFIICTCTSTAPGKPTLVDPSIGETVPVTEDLNWTANANWGKNCTNPTAPNTFNIYLSTANPPPELPLTTVTETGNCVAGNCYYLPPPGTFSESTQYFWKIDQCNGFACTPSDIWSFTTESAPTTSWFQALDNDIAAQGAITNNAPGGPGKSTGNHLIFGPTINPGVSSEKNWLFPSYSVKTDTLGSGGSWTNYADLWTEFGSGKANPPALCQEYGVSHWQSSCTRWDTGGAETAKNVSFPAILQDVAGALVTCITDSNRANDLATATALCNTGACHLEAPAAQACQAAPGGVYSLPIFNNKPYYIGGIANNYYYYLRNKPAIVFISGVGPGGVSLIFKSPFVNGMVPNKKNGVIFIVQGDVVVEPGVTQIDAVIFTQGKFWSSATYEKRTGDADYRVYSTWADGKTDNAMLTVNGSVIANGGFDLGRTRPATNGPAEKFVFDPKYYWLFKEVLSSGKTYWKEVAG